MLLSLASTQNDPSSVSPGLGGFLAFFFLAIALWLLMRNMNGHLRRMSFREAERKAAEEAANRSGQAGQADGAVATDRPEGATAERPDETGDDGTRPRG